VEDKEKYLPVCLCPSARTFPVLALTLVNAQVTALGVHVLECVSWIGHVSFEGLTCSVDGSRGVFVGMGWAAMAGDAEADEPSECGKLREQNHLEGEVDQRSFKVWNVQLEREGQGGNAGELLRNMGFIVWALCSLFEEATTWRTFFEALGHQ
jgi:hypothetical protein